MTRINLIITRDTFTANGGVDIDGEADHDVTVEVSEGVVDRYGYTDGGNGAEFELTADERERVRDLWERL